MNLSLTPDESQTLANLLDLAVKAGGLNVATSAIVIAQKVEAAAYPKPALVKDEPAA